jgi:aldehyde:ferredoxin oxidoreductase
MTVPPGYHGRYLRIDLSTQTSEATAIPLRVLRAFIGGSGLGTWILHRESEDRQDALSPSAPLIFAFSPLVGSPLTTSAKFAVLGQSPLTNRINDSLASSGFAIAGKKTGYDALVIVGQSRKPICLTVEPNGVRFLDARDLWGQTIPVAQELLAKKLDPGFRAAVIGPAGENLVRFATISHDGRHAGRGGLGAVMGSKRLKAIAVRGDRLPRFAHPERLAEYAKELSRLSLGPATAKYRELGTVANLLVFNRLGTLPTRNFQSGTFAHAEALAPETLNQTLAKTRASCAACTIGCEQIYQVSSTTSGGKPQAVRMEYENLFALGPLCGIGDAEMVFRASALCDELGLDTISTGATIAFAMECAERRLVADPELRFGNGRVLLSLIREIGFKRGRGEWLSQGTRLAAEFVGQGSEEFAAHVKGLELPGYEPRALQTMALGLAVGTRGADHNRSGAYEIDFSAKADRLHLGPDSVAYAIATENEAAVMDSLILCKFLRGVFGDRLAGMAEMLELVTGWQVDREELTAAAKRIISLKKWYNIRQGWTPAEDTLPLRFLSEPLADGPSQGAGLTTETLGRMIELYNRQRGWTSQGWLKAATLEDLQGFVSQKEAASGAEILQTCVVAP